MFTPARDTNLNGIISFNQIKNKRDQAVAELNEDDFS